MNIRAAERFRIAIAAAATLLPLPLPLPAATAPACGPVCAQWVLDEGSGGNLDALLDTALAGYRPPRPRRERQPPPTLEGLEQAEMERSLGPLNDRPAREELRRELQRLLHAPTRLSISLQGNDVLLAQPPEAPRRLSPGVPHARVDSWGTARISTALRDGRLTVTERYDRGRQYTQTYAVARKDGRLVVTQEVRRPGLKPLRLQTTYHQDLVSVSR